MVNEVPRGVNHLRMLARLSNETLSLSEPELTKYSHSLRLIGTSLSALYEAATCHRHCHGGPHLLESLAGRAYNFGCAAYILISSGFYDEALNLIRTLGEISNIILMSLVDKDAHQRWLSADITTRLREVSPAKLRSLLEAKAIPIQADKDWYSRFSENYVHVNPATKPNLHNELGHPHVGGVLQPAGLAQALDELVTALGFLAMPICKYFDLDDIYQNLVDLVRENGSAPAS